LAELAERRQEEHFNKYPGFSSVRKPALAIAIGNLWQKRKRFCPAPDSTTTVKTSA
jgi:hypothetical protein